MLVDFAGIAALITATGGIVLGIIGVRRQNRSAEAAETADAAKAHADEIDAEVQRRVNAQDIGLQFMREAMNVQAATISRLTGELGIVQGRLDACREESRQQTQQIITLQTEVAMLKRRP